MSRTRWAGLALTALGILIFSGGCEGNTRATTAGSSHGPTKAQSSKNGDKAEPAATAGGERSQTSASESAAPATEVQPPPAQPAQTPPALQPGADEELGQVDPAELVMPKVVFTDAHAKTNLVGVGDQMPPITLPNLQGKPQTLESLLGKRLTVVLFWTADNPYAVGELGDLETDLRGRFGPRGLEVVAIDERDSPQIVQQVVSRVAVQVPVLLDAQGQALGQLATGKLPRTYLLDSSGKILWFDIEYSRSTWRDLRRAIQYILTQG